MEPYDYYTFRVDHYKVVGLPSGEESAKITGKEISEAFKAQVLQFYYKLIPARKAPSSQWKRSQRRLGST